MPARYRKLRKIADGGMAELFLATQHGAEGFERRVVLKQILAPLLADPKFRNMIIDEAHVAMSLHHSNIAQVLDLGQSKGRTFLVLELVDGWDLNQILARVRSSGFAVPPELALYISAEVCRALAYAHAQRRDGRPIGIVHRDISPHNVLISEEGEVKLTDFGIAKAMGRREHTGQGIIKGKLAFMSPEQASGEELDARSDLFSVGTMLYLLFTGKRPFEAPTDLEIVLRVRQASYRPPAEAKPDLPEPITKLIEKTMARDRDARYQNGEELLSDLEAAQRTVFKPAGQTELRRWLRALGEKDGIPPISRAAALPTEHEDEIDVSDEDIVFEAGDVETIAPYRQRTKTAPSLVRAARAIEDAASAPQNGAALAAQDPSARTGSAQTEIVTTSRRWVLLAVLGGAVIGVGVLQLIGRLRGQAPPPPPPPAPAPAASAASGGATATPSGAGAGPGTPAAAVSTSGDATSAPDTAAPDDAGLDTAGADTGKTGDASDDDDEDEEALLRRREPEDQVIGDEAATVVKPSKARSKAPAAAVHEAPTPVSVKITSRPEGAVVKLGTRVFGRAPISLRFQPGATFEITLVKSGYQTAKKRFTVTGRAGQRVSVALKKKAVKRKGFFQRLFGR